MAGDEKRQGHDRCGADTDHGPCQQPAGFGTDHVGIGRCKFHLGCTPTHQRAASLELARRECDRLGIPIQVDPGEALIRELWETAGNVAFYRAMVQQLPQHPEPDLYVAGEDGKDGHWERGESGVYGRTYHVSGVPTGEGKPHVLVALYNEERKHLAAVAAGALKAGVEERRLRLAEADADRIMSAQVAALVSIGLGDRLDDFRRAFIAALEPVIAEPHTLGTTSGT